MRYGLAEGSWLSSGNYNIVDEARMPVFVVKGSFFSFGTELSFQRLDGTELVSIAQRLWAMTPAYELHRDGRPFAEVRKEFTWFNKAFTLDVPGPNDYSISGSFWSHEYTFERQGRLVARCSKEWGWTDNYGVEVADGEDDVAILATCVVIDLVCHED